MQDQDGGTGAAGHPRSLRVRTVGSALWLFTGAGAQGLLRLGVLAVLARLLGPEQFGLAAAALVVITFFRKFLQMSVRPALIQRSISRREPKPARARTFCNFSVSAGMSH